MLSTRLLSRTALVVGALALALPAAAGTLSGQLRDLANSYQKAPKTTVARLVEATTTSARQARLFAPHVAADGAVQVYLYYLPGQAPPRAALDLLGARDVRVSRPLGVVQAWVPIDKLHAAAALAGVSRVTLPIYARVKGAYGQQAAPRACSAVPTGLAIDNEGIAAERVGSVQEQGIKGEGVKIGIISNGAQCIASSQSAGYLPSSVYIPTGMTGDGSEGTAMLEEAHAIAPKATLGFCGVSTSADFLTCFNDLAAWGADVISDDLGFIPISYNYTNFPADDGGNAIVEFAQAHPGITLTTAAGNDGYDFYQANYKAANNPSSPGGPPISLNPTYTAGGPLSQYEASNRKYGSAMNFGAALGKASDSAIQVTLGAGNSLYGDLTWNDPVNGPYDDLDLFLLDQSGNVACQPSGSDHWCSSTLNQMHYAGDPKVALPPLEFLQYTNDTGSTQTLYLVALCFNCAAHGTNPLHIKLYGFANGGALFNYATTGGISGHAALTEEFTSAAAKFNRGFGVSATLEPYSDVGPFIYGDWSGAPQTRAKPDITGIDCITNSGAGGFQTPFCGTSAASPNVGAVVALLRGFAPSAEPDAAQWKQLVMDHANPDALTNYSKDAGGAGLVDAVAAVSSIAPSSVDATITSPTESPFTVDPNTDVSFTATCDYDGNGTPQYEYKWNFGGNSGIPDSTKLTPDPVQYVNGGIYTVTFTCSAGNDSDSDSVTAEVQAAATADDQSLDTGHNQKLTGQLTGTGIGGEQVSYTAVTKPDHGTVSISTDGGFTYTPTKGFSGTDSFQFQIDNGVEKSNTATVTIAVAKGSPPTASDGTLTTKENHSASGTLQASDPDGDLLTFIIVSQPNHGTASLINASTGAYTYTPDHGYSGSDSFTFKANDGNFDSNTAKVSITVKKISTGGGGGAFGGLGLGLLAGMAGLLLFLRRRR